MCADLYVNSRLSTVKTKVWVATVMTNNKHSQSTWTHNAKEDCVWKTVDEAAPNASRDSTELGWTRENSLNRRIDLGSKFLSEARSLVIVVGDRSVEIGGSEGVILDSHSSPPPVRLINSA
jgi:hypothetical protein